MEVNTTPGQDNLENLVVSRLSHWRREVKGADQWVSSERRLGLAGPPPGQ